uniref:Uncharacterized protein n=1 Tax=Solanum lycopersicum TaxID=4081 RepID=A0A3Q7IDP4_SOLLC
MPSRTVLSPSTDSSTNQTHVPNPEYETWKSHDRVILLWIKTTIDSSILGHIIQSQTTAEAWTSLHHIFQTQSLARVMTLRLQLQTMTKGSLSIMEYVQRKRTISNNLAMALQPVTNYELVTYILYGLDPSYGPFRTAINLRTPPVTCEELFGLLLQEEQKLADESGHVTLSANIANRQNFQSRPSYNSNPPTNQFQQRNPKSHDNKRPSNRPLCQICEKLDHLAKNCYNRYNDQYPPTNTPRPQANVATSSSAFLDPSWCLDSGATNHVTADVGNLSIASDYSGNDSLADLQGKVLLRGMIKHGLYHLAASHLPSRPTSFLAAKVPLQTWHDRLGHPHESVLRRLASSVNLPVSSNKLHSVCGPSQLGKSRRFHLASSHMSSSVPFELVYSDVWGPTSIDSVNGNKYFVQFLDDYSKFGLALLANPSLPLHFWEHAFSTSTYLHNRMISPSLNFQSPFSLLYNRSPDYSLLKIFGCLCYPFLRPYNNHKLQYRSLPCVFLGYSSKHKEYLCFHVSSSRLYIARHVIFDEQNFPYSIMANNSKLASPALRSLNLDILASLFTSSDPFPVPTNNSIPSSSLPSSSSPPLSATSEPLEPPIPSASASHVSASPLSVLPSSTFPYLPTLDSVFSLKDLGKLSFFLGIEVLHHHGSLLLSQSSYIKDIIHRSHLQDAKTLRTPADSTATLTRDGPPAPDATSYRRIVGALQYATITRPDISYVVNRVCQFMHDHQSLQAYSDAGWAATSLIVALTMAMLFF